MKKNYVKVLAIAMIAVLSLGMFAGCGGSNTASTDSSAKTETKSSKTYKIGIIQHTDNDSFTQMREAFLARMKTLGYTDENLKVDYKNAQGDMSNLNTICQSMISDHKDVIVPVVTPSTQALVNAGGNTPIIFMSVTNPVAAKIMTDLKKPVNNITGTSNAIPVGKIFELSKKLTPQVKTYGIIYNTAEANSVATVKNAEKYLKENGMNYVEAVVANASEVQQATQSLVGKVDSIFVPLDSVVNSAMNQVAEIANKAKLPVYTAADTMVVNGGFATVGVSYKKIGEMTANMVDQYLKGKKIENMPCETLDTYTTLINQKTADAIGVTIPEDMKSTAQIIHK